MTDSIIHETDSGYLLLDFCNALKAELEKPVNLNKLGISRVEIGKVDLTSIPALGIYIPGWEDRDEDNSNDSNVELTGLVSFYHCEFDDSANISEVYLKSGILRKILHNNKLNNFAYTVSTKGTITVDINDKNDKKNKIYLMTLIEFSVKRVIAEGV